jgi:hypothetical protein
MYLCYGTDARMPQVRPAQGRDGRNVEPSSIRGTMLTRARPGPMWRSNIVRVTVLLACLFSGRGVASAQTRSQATVVIFAGTAQHGMRDWQDAMSELEERARARGLSPSRTPEMSWFAGGQVTVPLNGRVETQLIMERLGASPEFTVVEAIGGVFGRDPATFNFSTSAAATLLRMGALVRPFPRRAAAFHAGLSAGMGWMQVELSAPNGQAVGSGSGGALAASIGLQSRSRGLRPMLEVGVRHFSATPKFDQVNVSPLGGAARFVFTNQADLEVFVDGRRTQFGGPYLLLGLAYGL